LACVFQSHLGDAERLPLPPVVTVAYRSSLLSRVMETIGERLSATNFGDEVWIRLPLSPVVTAAYPRTTIEHYLGISITV
jgi:hypothetical protein